MLQQAPTVEVISYINVLLLLLLLLDQANYVLYLHRRWQESNNYVILPTNVAEQCQLPPLTEQKQPPSAAIYWAGGYSPATC